MQPKLKKESDDRASIIGHQSVPVALSICWKDQMPEGDWNHIACKLAVADNKGISVARLAIGTDTLKPQWNWYAGATTASNGV